jgi:hypothetical protein
MHDSWSTVRENLKFLLQHGGLSRFVHVWLRANSQTSFGMEYQLDFRRKKRAHRSIAHAVDDAALMLGLMNAIGVTRRADVLGSLGCRSSCDSRAAASAGGTHVALASISLSCLTSSLRFKRSF